MEEQRQTQESLLGYRRLAHQEPEVPEHHFNLGVCLFQMSDYQGAIPAFEKAVALKPDFAEASYSIGLCHLYSKEQSLALEYFHEATRSDPNHGPAWLNLGLLQMDRGDYESAIQAFRIAHELHPEDADILKHLGSAHFYKGGYPAAIDALEKGLKMEEDDFSLEKLGLSFSALSQYEKAKAAYSTALNLNNQRPELWNNMGNCHLKLQQVREAENAYRQALNLDSQHPDYWFNLGELLFHYASLSESIEPFQKVLEITPDDQEALQYLAKAQIEQNPDKALENFEALLQSGDHSPETLKSLAGLYKSQGKKDKEIQVRSELSRLNSYDMDNNFAIAQLKLSQGEPETAYKLLSDCLSISEKEYQTWYKLAQSFQLEKKLEEEFDCLEKVIKANPEHLNAWKRLGLLALERNLPEKAFHYLKKAGPVIENDFDLWKTVTEQLAQAGFWDESLEAAEQVFGLANYHPKIWKDFFRYFKRAKEMPRFLDWITAKLFQPERPTSEAMAFGDLFIEFGYFELAEKLYAYLLEKEPENLEVLHQMALMFQLAGDLQKAKEVLEKGLLLEAGNYDLLTTLGECYYQEEDWDKANEYFLKATKTRRDDYRVWFNLGNIESRNQNYDKALEHYHASRLIYDQEPKTYYNEALILENLGQLEQAKDNFQKALKLDSKDAYSYAALGNLAMKGKDYKIAKRYFFKSLASDRKYMLGWNNLALVFVKLKEPAKTQSCLEELKRLKQEAQTTIED